MSSAFTTVDLLRHGEPEGGQRFRGALDDPLSPHGWSQMRAATAGYHAWEAIVSSPLIRCAAFAQELAGQLDRPLEIVADFQELHFGAWEGCTAAEVYANDPQALARFWNDPVAWPIPQAEPVEQFAVRIAHAWEGLMTRYRGRHVLLVAHGGVIRMVLRHILEMPVRCIWRIEVPFAAVSRIHCPLDQATGAQLAFHNSRLES